MVRALARSLLFVALSTLLLSCGDDGRIRLVVYSPHGEEILARFEKMFEAAHPDVNVIASNHASQECLSKLRAEKPNPRCDVFWGATDSLHRQAAAEGLLEPYSPTWKEAIDPRFRTASDLFHSQFVMLQVLIFNDDKMSLDDAPKGWADLISGRFKDRIVLRLPPPSGTMRGAFSWLIAWQAGLHGGDIEAGFEYLRTLHRQTKRYAIDPSEFYQAIQLDPSLVVGIWNMTDALFQKARYGYPLGVKLPEEGVPTVVDCIALVKKNEGEDPRRTDLAREFYEFVSSVDASVILAEEHFRIPTRQDIPTDRKPSWLRDLQFKPLPADAALAGEKSDEWMKYWDENIKSLKE